MRGDQIAVLLDRSGGEDDELVTDFDDVGEVTEDEFLFAVGGAGEVADVGLRYGGSGGVGVTHRLGAVSGSSRAASMASRIVASASGVRLVVLGALGRCSSRSVASVIPISHRAMAWP